MLAAGLLAYILAHFELIKADLPGLDTKGRLKHPLDPNKHPSFIYRLPNPTTAAAAFDPLKKGLNNLKPEQFYGLNCQLIVWAPKTYFNHLGDAAAVRCPLCSKPAHLHGWGRHLRRICALNGTFFLVGTRYICKNCKGEKLVMVCSQLVCLTAMWVAANFFRHRVSNQPLTLA